MLIECFWVWSRTHQRSTHTQSDEGNSNNNNISFSTIVMQVSVCVCTNLVFAPRPTDRSKARPTNPSSRGMGGKSMQDCCYSHSHKSSNTHQTLQRNRKRIEGRFSQFVKICRNYKYYKMIFLDLLYAMVENENVIRQQ